MALLSALPQQVLQQQMLGLASSILVPAQSMLVFYIYL